MVFLPNKNVIFVAGLGGIGLDTSREIVKAGPKVSEVTLNGMGTVLEEGPKNGPKRSQSILSGPNHSFCPLEPGDPRPC